MGVLGYHAGASRRAVLGMHSARNSRLHRPVPAKRRPLEYADRDTQRDDAKRRPERSKEALEMAEMDRHLQAIQPAEITSIHRTAARNIPQKLQIQAQING